MDVLVAVVGILVHLRSRAIAFLHIDIEALCTNGLILIGAGIIVSELYSRNGELTLIARHGEEVIDHVALHAIGCQTSLVCGLGIIFVNVLLSMEAEMLNLPTPPENPAGRVGNGSTWTVMPGATILRFTSM